MALGCGLPYLPISLRPRVAVTAQQPTRGRRRRAAGGGDGDLSPEEQLEGIRDYCFIFYMGRVHMSMTYLILFVTYTPEQL
jgi:hypothetical protein